MPAIGLLQQLVYIWATIRLASGAETDHAVHRHYRHLDINILGFYIYTFIHVTRLKVNKGQDI